MSSKLFSCFFLDGVLCSFRKSEESGIMDRCFSCSHYLRFCREMEAEEDAFFEELDRLVERDEKLRREKSHG